MSAFIESPRKGDHPNHHKHDHDMFQVLQSDVTVNGSSTPTKVALTRGNATYSSPGVASVLVEGTNAGGSSSSSFVPRGPVLLPYNGYGNGNDQVREAMVWPTDTSLAVRRDQDAKAKALAAAAKPSPAGLPSANFSQNRRPGRIPARGHLASSDLFTTFDYPDNRKKQAR